MFRLQKLLWSESIFGENNVTGCIRQKESASRRLGAEVISVQREYQPKVVHMGDIQEAEQHLEIV